MNRKMLLCVALLCGLGSSLFTPTPFGRVAMFDFAAYFLAPFLFIKSYRLYTRTERRLLVLAFLWFLGTCYSNWWREEPFDVARKGNAVVFNVWCMLAGGTSS